MPDVAPGAKPILFGNLKKTYTLVNRKATSMYADLYSMSWCTMFRFDCRVGGGVTCPNASRLLRFK